MKQLYLLNFKGKVIQSNNLLATGRFGLPKGKSFELLRLLGLERLRDLERLRLEIVDKERSETEPL